MMTSPHRHALILFTGLLAACTVGPDFKAPDISLPKQFQEQAALKTSAAISPEGAWWNQLRDPVLDTLIAQAIKNSPQLAEAEARVREARAIRGIASADAYPQLDAQTGYSRTHGSDTVPIGVPPGGLGPDQNGNLWLAGFDANWELDIFGGTRRAVESADASLAASIESRRDITVTLIAEVARNYIELRNTQQRLAIARQILALRQDTLKLTKAQYDSGLATSLDMARAQAELSDSLAEIPVLEATERSSIYRIGVLTGAMPEALSDTLSAALPIPSTNVDIPRSLPSDLLKRRPDIRAAEQRIAAANARIGVAQADLYPHFSLIGSAGFESLDAGTFLHQESGYYSVGPSISWLVFDAGRVRNRMQAEHARTDQATAEYQKTVLDALAEVESALVSYGHHKIAVQALTDEVAADRQAYDLAKRLYAKGLEDFLTVLEADRALHAAEDKLTNANRDTALSLIALYKSLGGGWEVAEPPASPAHK